MCKKCDDMKNSKSSKSMASSEYTKRSISRRNSPLYVKQKRLLLLYHASKCTHKDCNCPLGSRCAEIKQLWRHMKSCKSQNCDVPHCISSRFIAKHFKDCQDETCQICLPVREAIKRRKKEKNKQSKELEAKLSS